MKSLLRPAITLLLALTLVTGVLYPLAVTGFAQVVFPNQANGSLIVRDGKSIGSSLIGQPFADPKYFWSRPSATSPFADNSLSYGGSNLGPTNSALADAVKQRIEAPLIGVIPHLAPNDARRAADSLDIGLLTDQLHRKD